MKIKRGSNRYGDTILNVDGKYVIKGSNRYGDIIATVEGGTMSGAAAAVFLLLM